MADTSWLDQLFQEFYSDWLIFTETMLLSEQGLLLLYRRTAFQNDEFASDFHAASARVKQFFPFLVSDEPGRDQTYQQLCLTLLEKEISRSFPWLRAHAFVALWGSLEDLIYRLLAAWLENEPSAHRLSEVQRISRRFDQQTEFSPDQRTFYIIDRIERSCDSRLKRGIARFETLLSVFGLGGDVDSRTSRHLLEMQQLRNVIVHRQGVVDQRLIEICPWLSVKVGDKIYVDLTTYRCAFYAFHTYVLLVYRRAKAFYGQVANISGLWSIYDTLS